MISQVLREPALPPSSPGLEEPRLMEESLTDVVCVPRKRMKMTLSTETDDGVEKTSSGPKRRELESSLLEMIRGGGHAPLESSEDDQSDRSAEEADKHSIGIVSAALTDKDDAQRKVEAKLITADDITAKNVDDNPAAKEVEGPKAKKGSSASSGTSASKVGDSDRFEKQMTVSTRTSTLPLPGLDNAFLLSQTAIGGNGGAPLSSRQATTGGVAAASAQGLQGQALQQAASLQGQQGTLQLSMDTLQSMSSSQQNPSGLIQQSSRRSYPAEWSALGAAGILPGHSSVAAMELASQQAAMVNLSMQERARQILAREQQHSAVQALAQAQAAVQRHAVAVASGAQPLSSLSQPQASVFAPSAQGVGQFVQQQTPGTAHFAHLGAHQTATAILSGSASHTLIAAQQHHLHPPSMVNKVSQVGQKGQANCPVPADPSSGNQAPDGPSMPGATARQPIELSESNDSTESQTDKKTDQKSGIRESIDKAQKSDANAFLKDPTKEELEAKESLGNENKGASLVGPLGEQKDSKSKGTDSANTLHVRRSSNSNPSARVPTPRSSDPPSPPTLSGDIAGLIRESSFHKAVDRAGPNMSIYPSLLEYLRAVASAIPIPISLVSNPLKDRLNAPSFKILGANVGAPVLSHEIVSAVIVTWLWTQHRCTFQQSLENNVKIDTDAGCKWLIQAAVDASVRALVSEFADSGISCASPTKGTGSSKSTLDSVHVASVVNEALMSTLCVDENLDLALPNTNKFVNYLDELRCAALRAKCQERALIAALISRRVSMSEPFSHSYVSSLIRAGEALGYEELCEIVEDETSLVSTMIPFDIFRDETGAWEDPCRPPSGFSQNLTGDELTKRAHARAMIHKSLKKMQERLGMKGGVADAGPYKDVPAGSASTFKCVPGQAPPPPSRASSTLSLKRKTSFGGLSDATGASSRSISAANSALFNPNHYSSPFMWDTSDTENSPYGRQMKGGRRRSYSSGRFCFSGHDDLFGASGNMKRPRPASSPPDGAFSLAFGTTSIIEDESEKNTCSTTEINWADVAQMFQPVSLSPPTPSSKDKSDEHVVIPVAGADIFAPFVRDFDPTSIDDTSVEGQLDSSSDDEDMSDEAVLARHQVVLDHMKKKLDAALESRRHQQQQQRARSRSSGGGR